VYRVEGKDGKECGYRPDEEGPNIPLQTGNQFGWVLAHLFQPDIVKRVLRTQREEQMKRSFLLGCIRSRGRCVRATATPAADHSGAAAELCNGIPQRHDDFLRWNVHW